MLRLTRSLSSPLPRYHAHSSRRPSCLRATGITTILVLLVAVVPGHAAVQSPWHPMRWTPCDHIVAPWYAPVQSVITTLRRNGVMGVRRRGEVTRGTLSVEFRDEERRESVELVFDTNGRFVGASTEHRVSTTEAAKAFVGNTIGRLVVGGGRIIARRATSTDIALACNGVQMTMTIGIDPDRPLVALFTVMVERDASTLLAD